MCQESTTLLVPSMFASLGFMEMMLDERDSDVALEVTTTYHVSITILTYPIKILYRLSDFPYTACMQNLIGQNFGKMTSAQRAAGMRW